jgi:hypothetical protein
MAREHQSRHFFGQDADGTWPAPLVCLGFMHARHLKSLRCNEYGQFIETFSTPTSCSMWQLTWQAVENKEKFARINRLIRSSS